MSLGLAAMAGMLETVTLLHRPHEGRGRSALAAATDLAEHLVAQGRPFRDAHAIVGGADPRGRGAARELAELVRAHPDFGAEADVLLEPGVVGDAADDSGGAGPEAVAEQRRGSPPAWPPTASGSGADGFIHRVRVRYGEVDMQRVVFNAHYLAYCDDAADLWFRTLGRGSRRALGHHGQEGRAGMERRRGVAR